MTKALSQLGKIKPSGVVAKVLATSHLTYPFILFFPAALCFALFHMTSVRNENLILVGVISGIGLVTALEWLIPRDSDCRLLSNRRELGLNLAFIPVIAFGVDLPLKLIVYQLLLPVVTSIGFVPWPQGIPVVLQVLAILLMINLMNYWWHRLMHTVDWGWRIHRVHHSSRVFNWAIGPKVHLFDAFALGVINVLPLLIFDVQGIVYVLALSFRQAFELLTHTNIRMNLSFWNYIFMTRDYHVWHHSTVTSESNHNYSNLFVLFDSVFGTLYLPEDRSRPDAYGLTEAEGWLMTDSPVPLWQLMLSQLLSPFAWRRKTAARES